MMTNIDYEHIYQLIFRKEWVELLDIIVHKYSKITSSDEQVMRAVKIFEDEFFIELDKGNENDNIAPLLNNLLLLHIGRTYKLPEERFVRVVVELTRIYSEKGRKEEAYRYAELCPKNEACANFMKNYKNTLPKVIEHSQSDQIRVTENRKIVNENYTTSLFKSRQEEEFFMGVREAFPMYTVYPNVALSCVINFDKIKIHLSQEERAFFFKGIIDCVVFDHHKNYKPTRFYELDSFYHDSPEQKQKDSYKDNILSLAGQRLNRIRQTLGNQGRNEFMMLVREMG